MPPPHPLSLLPRPRVVQGTPPSPKHRTHTSVISQRRPGRHPATASSRHHIHLLKQHISSRLFSEILRSRRSNADHGLCNWRLQASRLCVFTFALGPEHFDTHLCFGAPPRSLFARSSSWIANPHRVNQPKYHLYCGAIVNSLVLNLWPVSKSRL